MGVNLSSKNNSIDIGYFGFARLRDTIANLCPKEITDYFLYFRNNWRNILADEDALDKYNAGILRLHDKYGDKYGEVLDFLYMSDCDGEMTCDSAKQLLEVIGDYDNDEIYGYIAHGEHAVRLRHFKELLHDAVDTKTNWKWS